MKLRGPYARGYASVVNIFRESTTTQARRKDAAPEASPTEAAPTCLPLGRWPESSDDDDAWAVDDLNVETTDNAQTDRVELRIAFGEN